MYEGLGCPIQAPEKGFGSAGGLCLISLQILNIWVFPKASGYPPLSAAPSSQLVVMVLSCLGGFFGEAELGAAVFEQAVFGIPRGSR